MTSQRVLILAAGEAKRMKGASKQLLPVKNETIIARIIRQVRTRGGAPWVVTLNPEIIRAVHKEGSFVFKPREQQSTCATFVSTYWVWEERTIILLGDVIYSKALMDRIFACDDPIRVFGNAWEIFAISFSGELKEKIADTLDSVKDVFPGKLRTFYKVYCGFEVDTPETEGEYLEDVVFALTEDWSRDVDSLEEFANMQKELVNCNVLDDRKPV